MINTPRLVVRSGGLRTDLPDGTVCFEWLALGLSVQLGRAATRLASEFVLPRTVSSVVDAHGGSAPDVVERATQELVSAGVLIEYDPNADPAATATDARAGLRSADGGVFGLPVHTLEAALNGGFDTVVVGVPSDSGTSYRPGSRFAPAVIRRLSRSVTTLDGDAGVYNPESADQMLIGRRIADVGDICTPRSFEPASLADLVTSALRRGVAVVTIGGDHSISLPAIQAAARLHPGRLGVIHIDAHHDYGRPRTGVAPFAAANPDGSVEAGGRQLVHHGNFLDWVVGDPHVAQLVHAGVRQLTRAMPTPTDKRVSWPGRTALAAAGGDFIASLDPDRPWYLSIDVDVLDPSVMPDTGTPVPGGWLSHELINLVRAVGDAVPVVAADVAEYLPSGAEWPGVTASYLLAYVLDAIDTDWLAAA